MNRNELLNVSTQLLAGRLAASGGQLTDREIAETVRDADRLIVAVDKLAGGKVPTVSDDNEPVTEDWLRSVGLEGWAGLGVPLTHELSLWNSSKGWGLYFHGGEGDGYRASEEDKNGPALLTKTKTRGHVRRLCAALGIPLKEPTPTIPPAMPTDREIAA